MIWELRLEFTIKLLLEVSGLARSTYYYYIEHRNDEDKYSEIKEQITNIFCENKERYLGYEKSARSDSDDARNGYKSKRITTSYM